MYLDKKDNCDVGTSSELLASDKVGIYPKSTKTESCGSNTPIKTTDDPGKYIFKISYYC